MFDGLRIPRIPVELSRWRLPIYRNATQCIYVRNYHYILINYLITTNSIMDIYLATFGIHLDWLENYITYCIVINVSILFWFARQTPFNKSWRLWKMTYCHNSKRIIFCILGSHDTRPLRHKLSLSLLEIYSFLLFGKTLIILIFFLL